MLTEAEVKKMFGVKRRTTLQNASLHLGCDKLAKAMNAAGFDQKKALEALPKVIETDNTMESVKALYKLIMKAKLEYESTTQLSTTEITEVWDQFNIILGKILTPKIMVAWPCEAETKAYIDSLKKSLNKNYS